MSLLQNIRYEYWIAQERLRGADGHGSDLADILRHIIDSAEPMEKPMLDVIGALHLAHPGAITYHWQQDVMRHGVHYCIEIDFKKVVVPVERSVDPVPAVTYVERPAPAMPERPMRRLNFRRGKEKEETAT